MAGREAAKQAALALSAKYAAQLANVPVSKGDYNAQRQLDHRLAGDATKISSPLERKSVVEPAVRKTPSAA
jgi:hypothetical protein